ncbi:MAG: hypothetical protein V4730_10535 [Pseudomonadota bacterium]
MNRIPRKTIALCMSFVLLIFTICQAQAMTRVVFPATDTAAAAMSTSSETPAGCHEQAVVQDSVAPDCHGECQHVHQADIAKKLQLLDVTALVALFELPLLADRAGTARLSRLPAWVDPGDPHPVIRFQRFLE